MSSDDDSRKGICILSLDSGGPGTYSQLLIVQEYMNRLATDLGVSEEDLYPADYFDLIGGVGFGGLAAVMLGLLRMNVTEAINAVIRATSAIFPEGSTQAIDKDKNSRNLKAAVEGMLVDRDTSLDTKMYERSRPPSRCKVVLYAAASTDMNHAHLFRSYPHRGSGLNPTIIEAVCATISIPSHFSPVNIGPRRRAQRFVGSPLGVKNPTRELLKEAGTAFGGDQRVAQIISIGCEAPHVLSLEEMKDEVGVGKLLKEMAVDCQMVAKDLSTRLYDVEAYLRLNLEKGINGVEFHDWSGLGDVETHTRIYIGNATVTSTIDASLRSMQRKVGTISLGQLNQSSSIKVAAKTLPSVCIHYVARAKPWGIMVHHLITFPRLGQKIFTITGMGGCGKTQMVAYFFQEYPLLYTRVVVVDASSLSSIESDLQTWARNLGNSHERDVWEDGLRILSSIPQDERWALILDNADDPTLKLVSFMPKNVNLTIVITSRNRDLGSLSTTYHLELGEMEEDEALETLLHAARRTLPISTEERDSARALVKELGYLALALAQAGTYCHQLSSQDNGIVHPYTFTQYYLLFCTHRAKLMKKAQPMPLDSYERGVYTTLDLSYHVLPQQARDFIHFISFFHHTNIPLAALAAAARNGFEDEESLIPRPEGHKGVLADLADLLGVEREWNEFQLQETIARLRAFSLISSTPIAGTLFLQMHPLVQAWSRDMLSLTSRKYREMAMQVLTSCHGDDSFLLHRHITPHIFNILGQLEIRDIHVNDLMSMGEVLRDQGHYRKAIELVEVALREMANCVVKSREKMLVVNARLASLYWYDGRWDEAKKLDMEVLEQRTEALGTEHPDTITAAANLATTYHSQGRWIEAEKLYLEVLEQRRNVLGMEHPDTITAASDLASAYQSQGRWSEAEKLYLEVLEQLRNVLGMEHPDTIRAAANLATTYHSQGRWSEAEKVEVEVLEQREKVLGMEHPDTIRAAANLATTYHSQGRWSEAEKLEVEVLEQQEKVLGMEHPDTIRATANLASTYNSQGRWSEAEKLEVEVLEQREKILGMEHPETILATANLAITYHTQGRFLEAVELLAVAVKLFVKVLGQQHPNTQDYAKELVQMYVELGKQQEAQETKALLLS